MRMRTIEEAAAYMQSCDPQTALTKTALRRLVTTGQLPSVRIGTKYLISLEALETFLAGGTENTIPLHPAEEGGAIRPIEAGR